MSFRRLLPTALFCLLVFACRGHAQAALHVCDRSPQPATVALALVEPSATGTVIQSEGWWQVDAGTCTTVIDNDLQPGVLYYLYGKSPQYFWAGKPKKGTRDAQFCANQQDGFNYVNRGAAECTSPGDEMSWFLYETIGGADWTIDLYMPQ